MGARQKLNQAYLNGALVIAAAIAAGSSLHSGDIRLRGRGKP